MPITQHLVSIDQQDVRTSVFHESKIIDAYPQKLQALLCYLWNELMSSKSVSI